MDSGSSTNCRRAGDDGDEGQQHPPVVVELIDLLGLRFEQFQAVMRERGMARDSIRTIWSRLQLGPGNGSLRPLFDSLPCPTAQREPLPDRLRGLVVPECELITRRDSQDGFSRKFLFRVAGGARVESVLMRFAGRASACLSTQAGCPLDCVFCATGQAPFSRSLTAGEIVAQAYRLDQALRCQPVDGPAAGDERAAEEGAGEQQYGQQASQRRKPVASGAMRGRGIRLRNIVLMGMGEPLLNYDQVRQAMSVLRDCNGLAIGAKRITLSTVGVIPGIIRLADEAEQCSLAVSLHAANQQDREALIPAARRWPLGELLDACRYYCRRLHRAIFIEWTMIAGRNDSIEHARQLAAALDGIQAHVNLIPLNATRGFAGESAPFDRLRAFQATLRQCGIPSTVRQPRGLDVNAGCGQLAARVERASKLRLTEIPKE